MSAANNFRLMMALPLAAVSSLLFMGGCDRGAVSSVVTVTNVVERTIYVTNVVTRTMTVTNAIAGGSVSAATSAAALTKRHTAAYAVATTSMRGSELRKFLIGAGARVIECSPGALAIIEAPDKVLAEVGRGGVVQTRGLTAADRMASLKVAKGVRQYDLIPLSSIDCAAIVAAVRELGGELVRVVTVGESVVKAKLNESAVRMIAERSDILKIKETDK